MFKEELFYLREVILNDYIKVTCEVTRSEADGSHWSIRYEIYLGDGVKPAVINVDGAWIDIKKRRVAKLPSKLGDLFLHALHSSGYTEEILQPK